MKNTIKTISMSYWGVFLGFMIVNLMFKEMENIGRGIIFFAIGYLIALLGIFTYYWLFKVKSR